MAPQELTDTTALVTGASRGFGCAVAVALRDAGASVVAVARSAEQLGESHDQLVGSLTTVAADVADPVVAGALLEQYRPKTLVLNAGAAPLMRRIRHHTWDTFSRNWEVDVRQAFHWIRFGDPAGDRERMLIVWPPIRLPDHTRKPRGSSVVRGTRMSSSARCSVNCPTRSTFSATSRSSRAMA